MKETAQMEADRLLEEHRAVMAALIRNEIRRPTQEQYADQLRSVQEEMSKCLIFTSDLSLSVSAAL